MQNSIDKINRIGNEVRNATVHMKNVGNAITGKELVNPESVEVNKIFEKLKAPYQNRKDVFDARTEKLSAAIEKVEKLEHTKASVIGKLAENKAKIEAKEAAGKEEKTQQKEKQTEAAR